MLGPYVASSDCPIGKGECSIREATTGGSDRGVASFTSNFETELLLENLFFGMVSRDLHLVFFSSI